MHIAQSEQIPVGECHTANDDAVLPVVLEHDREQLPLLRVAQEHQGDERKTQRAEEKKPWRPD